jgi:hypothetical protein
VGPAERDYHALRGHAGIEPITKQSGKHRGVLMRYACKVRLRNALYHTGLESRRYATRRANLLRRAARTWPFIRPHPPRPRRSTSPSPHRHAQKRLALRRFKTLLATNTFILGGSRVKRLTRGGESPPPSATKFPSRISTIYRDPLLSWKSEASLPASQGRSLRVIADHGETKVLIDERGARGS